LQSLAIVMICCLSHVCLSSVMVVYYDKTAEDRITQFSLKSSVSTFSVVS